MEEPLEHEPGLLSENRVEVVTGLNLPMLIQISNCREGRSLQ
jgi:mannose/fructose-specific phosphotransferase system component IIA